MDNLTEQVVKVKKTAKYYINIILIITAAVGIPAGLIVLAEVLQRAYLIYIAFFLVLVFAYLSWLFITSLNIEYEYSILGSTMLFDKIIAKRRRKNLLKLEVKEIEEFFPYSDTEMGSRKFAKVYDISGVKYSDKNYVATFFSQAKGNCALIFSPNDKFLKAMKPYFNQNITLKIYKEKLF